MTFLSAVTFDAALHLGEVIAIVFWVGKSYGDLQWLKHEVTHLRTLVENMMK